MPESTIVINTGPNYCLDRGEASVVKLAINEGIETVCIDEHLGRRVARLNGLRVTGSLGILIRAKREGHSLCISDAVSRPYLLQVSDAADTACMNGKLCHPRELN